MRSGFDCGDTSTSLEPRKSLIPVHSPHGNLPTAMGTCLLLIASAAVRPTGAMRFREVLIVKDPASYQDASETHSAQHVSQQKIEAERLGECPGLGAGAPLTPTPKPRRH